MFAAAISPELTSVVEMETTSDWMSLLQSEESQNSMTLPDGPLVKKYKAQNEEKLFNEAVVEQSRELNPMLEARQARAKFKLDALKRNAEIRNDKVIVEAERHLKQRARLEKNEFNQKNEEAKVRRMERAVKHEEMVGQADKERLQKVHTETAAALRMTTMMAQDKELGRKAAQKEEARHDAQASGVGGLIDLKGDQIIYPSLVRLSKALKTAWDTVSQENFRLAEIAFNNAAEAVALEEAKFIAMRDKRNERHLAGANAEAMNEKTAKTKNEQQRHFENANKQRERTTAGKNEALRTEGDTSSQEALWEAARKKVQDERNEIEANEVAEKGRISAKVV